MAGIGFELKKLFRRKGLFASLRAYGYAGIICTGPMLLGVVLQFGILLLCGWVNAQREQQDLLVCMITYTLLFSLTVTSFFSMPVTRYLADMLYVPILSDLYKELKSRGDIALRISNSLMMYVNGSQNLFNHRTNIDLNNRIVCFDIKELGNQLKKVGMLIVQDTVWNRVTQNRAERKVTRYYIDEFHLLLKEQQTAQYSAEIWKRFRKWGGVPTGITQNVKDLLSSSEVENIFDNSDFVYMLNQAAGDRDILSEKLHISAQQMECVTNSGQGEGLIKYGGIVLPFTDTFPTNTTMYRLMTTKPEEQQLSNSDNNEDVHQLMQRKYSSMSDEQKKTFLSSVDSGKTINGFTAVDVLLYHCILEEEAENNHSSQ